jgi:hypothetical protein
VAACVQDIYGNFYFVKRHKIANNSATAEAREKVSTDLESLELILVFFGVCLTNFENCYLIQLATDF